MTHSSLDSWKASPHKRKLGPTIFYASSNVMKTRRIFRNQSNIYDGVFSYLGFLSLTFTFHSTAGEGGGSFLPLPPISQTLRHYPDDYCKKVTSAHC